MGRKRSPLYRNLQNRLAVALLRGLGLLPWSVNRALGGLAGRILAAGPNPARRVTRVNLELCLPELSTKERRRLERRSLAETGKGILELARLWRRPEEGLARVRSVEGDETLRSALAAGEPVVVLVPHLGCWEVLNFWLSRHFDFHALFNPSGLNRVDRLIEQGRQHFGSTMYPATGRGVAGLVRALRRGALTAILPDQVPDRRGGRFAPFFGRPAFTGTLAPRLIQQSGARVFMARAERLAGQRGYAIAFREPDPAIYSEDLDTTLAGLNRSVESLIRELPEQYLWSYKRFRRMPDREQKPY
jgi:KDO2-lipid IV(A) lauroyltransferase